MDVKELKKIIEPFDDDFTIMIESYNDNMECTLYDFTMDSIDDLRRLDGSIDKEISIYLKNERKVQDEELFGGFSLTRRQ